MFTIKYLIGYLIQEDIPNVDFSKDIGHVKYS